MKYSVILNELSNENEKLKQAINNVQSKFVKTDKAILESLTRISFILYVENDLSNALLLTEKLSKISFNNDYDYWTWIEFAVALRAKISEIMSDDKRMNDSLRIISEALDYGEGLQKKIKNNVHNRFMAGEGVELDSLTTAKKNKNMHEEFNCRLIYLMKLIKLDVLGGSEEYSVEKARENIDNNVKRMLQLIQDNALDGVQPFK